MSLPLEELHRRLANLNLYGRIINNSVNALSSSSSQRFEHSWSSPCSCDFIHSSTEDFDSTCQVMFGNNFRNNCAFRSPIPSFFLDLETLRTMPVTSLIMYAQTEIGSMRLQNILMLRKSEITELVLGKVMTTSELGNSYIFYLMNDEHGWHVFSKLIDVCNEEQLRTIVMELTWNNVTFIQSSLTKFGSCSVKKLIKVLKKSPFVGLIVDQLAIQFYSVMTQKYGLYIVTECLDQLDEEENLPLYSSAMEYWHMLATHKRGCVSLNTIVEKIRGPLRGPLINKICDNAAFLAFDTSGNYVVQKVLSIENPNFTHKITENLRGKFPSLSKMKSGSHLVEKCLNSTRMKTVVKDLIDRNQVLSVAKDQYGNYVIQTALRVSKGMRVHSILVRCIYRNRERLLHGYGRNVLNAIADEHIRLPHQPY